MKHAQRRTDTTARLCDPFMNFVQTVLKNVKKKKKRVLPVADHKTSRQMGVGN
jgi:hypothetical protein